MNTRVPFQDLHKQYLSIKGEIDSAIEKVISESSFVRGPHVDLFENNFASLLGSKYCISCGNGTDSLFIAIKALGAPKALMAMNKESVPFPQEMQYLLPRREAKLFSNKST